jgi:organic radical activating enzyme
MRYMANEYEGKQFYESVFNPETGSIARIVEVAEECKGSGRLYYSRHGDSFTPTLGSWLRKKPEMFAERDDTWRDQFGHRERAFSPSPETLDIQITNWCSMGCSYCYQSSTTEGKHCDPELPLKVIQAFTHAPYQIAYGGGEPTYHPQFVEILKGTKALDVVPNYTTAGQVFQKESKLKNQILQATNDYCGGVALTYHKWKGEAFFTKAFEEMSVLNCMINIHVIADKDVVESLAFLTKFKTPLNIVLLAYHPVGFGDWTRVMPKPVYQTLFPEALKTAIAAGHRIAYSEGLLSYFLSRPEIGVATMMAEASEGIYSAYVDMTGRMTQSSFVEPSEYSRSLEKGDLQSGWSGGIRTSGLDRNYPKYEACGTCKLTERCAITHSTDYMQCAFAEHNK